MRDLKTARNTNDILSKHLTTAFPRGVLDVIGIGDANVVRALPTELDEVIIRQKFTDVVLELDDGSILHIEFQSERERALYRFLGYDVALAEHFRRKVRTVVMYVGDVYSAPDTLDIGSAKYRVENVFLNQLDGDAALDTVKRHLSTDEWGGEDRIRLAFAFHMRFSKRTRDEVFEQVIGLTRLVPDKMEQNYITALILGLSGRMFNEEQNQRLKETMRMTDVVREIEREAEHKKAVQIARKLLAEDVSIDIIEKTTELSRDELDKLREQLQ